MKEARTLYAFLVFLRLGRVQLSLVQNIFLVSSVAICFPLQQLTAFAILLHAGFLDTVSVCLSQGVHGHQRSAVIAQT